MQTQCPHCGTRFRVTETQVSIADGLVRCGVCQEVFNAFEVTDDEQQPSLLIEDTSSAPVETENDEPFNQSASTAPSVDQQDNHVSEYTEHDAVSETAGFQETPPVNESQKDTFDFFNEDDNEIQQHLIPDEFRNDARQSSSVISTLLWSIGILLLTASLFIEYAWFNRNQPNQIPQLQVWLEESCQYLECKDINMRDPAKIELLTRNVYSHPNAKQALMVNVTMKNNANFAQPYPVMQIDFSDVRGGTVAARRFLPNEYLPMDIQKNTVNRLPLLQPEESASVTMEIQDPGTQAMTYEFNFL